MEIKNTEKSPLEDFRGLELLIRENIRTLSPYSSARDEYTDTKGVFLDANENPYGTINRYPDPYQRLLKKKLSEIKNISVENIFIGNGSDEIIDIAFRIFCEPHQSKALTFTPTYGMYEVSAQINAVEMLKLPLTANFQIDTQTLKPYLADKNLKLIFICSPNNPTGNLMSAKDVEFILDNFDGITIIDEAYIDFCGQESFISKLEKYPRLIVSQTLSKAWASAAIRLGTAYMHTSILSYYNKVKAPYNISILNQQRALEVLNNKSVFEEKLQLILDEKATLIESLKASSHVKKIYPTDANFVLVEVDDANKLYNTLIDHKVIVRNRHSVVNNCLRITIGTKAENKLLMDVLNAL